MNLRVHIALVFLFSSFILFSNLGAQSVRPLDEAKWAQISREMIKSGDWITPRIGGRPFRHKPPLRMWLNTAAFCVFGENEFALRFWSAVSGIGILILTYLLSYVLCRNTLISLASSLILLFSPIFVFEYLRMGDEHATFTFLFLLSLYFFWLSRESKKYLYFSSIFFGLSFLAYGFGAFFTPLIIFSYLIIAGEIKIYKSSLFIRCLLISFVVILPWYIFQYAVNGTNFLKIYLAEATYYFNANIIRGSSGFINFLGQELINKMVSCIDASFFRGPDFYFNVLRFALFPWWVPVLFYLCFIFFNRLANIFRSGEVKLRKEGIFIIVWVVCVLGVLFLFGDKMSWRIYFLFPAFAILAAKSLVWFCGGKKMKLATIAVILLLIALYNLRLIIPIYLGPSSIRHIELYGFRKVIDQPAMNNLNILSLMFLLLCVLILSVSYVLSRRKNSQIVHNLTCLILFLYLFFIGIKNTADFFSYNKGKSDIDLIVEEIKKIPGISKIVIYDHVLYNMEKGVIAPEYSLGGAATGDKGKHRWDSYYYLHSLDIEKEYVDNLKDLKALLENESKTKTVLIINKNTWESIEKDKPYFLINLMLDRGDYFALFLK